MEQGARTGEGSWQHLRCVSSPTILSLRGQGVCEVQRTLTKLLSQLDGFDGGGKVGGSWPNGRTDST